MLLRRIPTFAALALAGCLVSIDESRIPGGTGAGGHASGAGGHGGGAACPASMIEVPARDAGQPATCFDATEVTVAAYAAFVASSPALATLPALCAWKTSFSPKPTATTEPLAPATQVDWCDAYEYCASVGKRLCGKTGGGPGAFADGTNASLSEWFNACTKGGTRAFPYGVNYVAAACVGADYDGDPGYQNTTDVLRPVGEAKNCEGGFQGLFGMSGNATEWEDSCQSSGDACAADPAGGVACDWCRARGGSYGRPPGGAGAGLSCSDSDNERRSARYDDMGFRCCADPK